MSNYIREIQRWIRKEVKRDKMLNPWSYKNYTPANQRSWHLNTSGKMGDCAFAAIKNVYTFHNITNPFTYGDLINAGYMPFHHGVVPNLNFFKQFGIYTKRHNPYYGKFLDVDIHNMLRRGHILIASVPGHVFTIHGMDEYGRIQSLNRMGFDNLEIKAIFEVIKIVLPINKVHSYVFNRTYKEIKLQTKNRIKEYELTHTWAVQPQ